MLRRPLASLMAAAALSGLTAPGAAQPQPGGTGLPDFRRALDTLLARFVEAYNRKDVVQLAALFTETRSWCRPGPSWPGSATSRSTTASASSTAPWGYASRSRRRRRKATPPG